MGWIFHLCKKGGLPLLTLEPPITQMSQPTMGFRDNFKKYSAAIGAALSVSFAPSKAMAQTAVAPETQTPAQEVRSQSPSLPNSQSFPLPSGSYRAR